MFLWSPYRVCASTTPSATRPLGRPAREQLGVSRGTVVKWRNRFVVDRVGGLLHEARPGRPRATDLGLAGSPTRHPPHDDLGQAPYALVQPGECTDLDNESVRPIGQEKLQRRGGSGRPPLHRRQRRTIPRCSVRPTARTSDLVRSRCCARPRRWVLRRSFVSVGSCSCSKGCATQTSFR